MNVIGRLLLLTGLIIATGLRGSCQTHFLPIEFLQNKGQWDSSLLFKGELGGDHVFLRPGGFTFMMVNSAEMTRAEETIHGTENLGVSAGGAPRKSTSPLIVHGDTYTMDFVGANSAVKVTADHPFGEYYNYFIGNDSTKWAGHVQAFGSVLYKGLYPGIDMQVYSDASQLVYDLVVLPGGDPGQISMNYQGESGLELRHGQIIIHTGVGDMIGVLPSAYQMVSGNKVIIPCAYRLTGNRVSFDLKNYDRSLPLIIDPLLVFSTFTGSRGDNWGYTATYDAQGNFYAGGIIFGETGNYVTTPGAFQQNFAGGQGTQGEGGYDMAICKFDPTGAHLIWATYLGGSGDEQPHSLVVDQKDELIIAGRTDSPDFPALVKIGPGSTAGTGNYDIVITKLNESATALVGSIQIGGSGDDGVNISVNRELGTTSLLRNYGDDARSEVEIDGAGNIYLASCTQSKDFPVTAGVFQPAKGDSSSQYDDGLFLQDGVVMKLNPDLSALDWASYLGGSGNDAAYVVELDGVGDLYVAGGTGSSNLPTTPGVIQPVYGGGACDGFIAEISNDGTTLMRLTYLGTSAADQIYGLQFDNLGNVYVTGVTEGSWPVVNAPFSNPGSKQFISKLSPTLAGPFIYSTIFGVSEATPNISPVAFLVDKCQNVYVSGWGGQLNTLLGYTAGSSGTKGMPITGNAIQPTTAGSDFYFFVLQKNATAQLYGTYYGEAGLLQHVDGGTSRFDPNGVIYEAICGGCGKGREAVFPTTPGAWSQVDESENCNEVALKIAFDLSGVLAGVRSVSGVTAGCTPLNLQFEDTIAQGKQYVWDYGDGSPEYSDTVPQSQVHIYNTTGIYQVRLISIDSSSCNVADTSYMMVRARSDAATVDFVPQKLPPCNNLSYQFTNTSTSPAGKPFGTSFLWDFGDGTPEVADDTARITHGYSSPGNYQVKLVINDTNYCNSPDSLTQEIRLSPQVQAVITTPSSGCSPYNAVFVNNSMGGLSFSWSFGDGTPPSNSVNPTHLYPDPGTYIVTLAAQDSTSCNLVDTASDTIQVFPPPVAGFAFSPVTPQSNTPTQFSNNSTGATTYLWNFGDGSSDTVADPSHIFPKTGNFNVCLAAENGSGCVDTTCNEVSAIIIPGFDIPSAFSPNGDGINDIFKPEGYGIVQMDMRIFNRWGQLMFESNNPNVGWDGKFKGVIQPMDVYAYSVTVAFSDGTRTTRTGSVTLIR